MEPHQLPVPAPRPIETQPEEAGPPPVQESPRPVTYLDRRREALARAGTLWGFLEGTAGAVATTAEGLAKASEGSMGMLCGGESRAPAEPSPAPYRLPLKAPQCQRTAS